VEDKKEEIEETIEEKPKVRKKVKVKKEKKPEIDWQEKYLRLAAEFENYKKRTEKERLGIYSDAVASTAQQMLTVLDSTEQALKSNPKDKGIIALQKQINDIYEKLGITEIENKTFDPTLHQAIMHVEDKAYGTGEIVEVFAKGYKIGEKIIRHSMVKTAN